MDFGTLSQLIGALGFPIVCCLYLFHSNEKLRSTIEENTKAILELKYVIHEHNLKEDNK